MKTLEQVFAEYEHRKRFGTRYAQTAEQFARGPELARRITGESLYFRQNADRYECDEQTGQYLLDLPPAA